MLIKRKNQILIFLSDYEDLFFSSLEIAKGLKMNLNQTNKILKILCRQKQIEFEIKKTDLKKIPYKIYKHKK